LTASKLIVLDVLPKGRNLNQLHFADNLFPYLRWKIMRSGRSKEEPTAQGGDPFQLFVWNPRLRVASSRQIEQEYGDHRWDPDR
jgi:hypothetical protein